MIPGISTAITKPNKCDAADRARRPRVPLQRPWSGRAQSKRLRIPARFLPAPYEYYNLCPPSYKKPRVKTPLSATLARSRNGGVW